jgi:abequosyltransferase
MDALRLSVCIPTYNFGRFIGETLDSILGQIQVGVEIVVLDSGSTDETQSVVLDLQRKHSCIRYERVEERQGIDRDMARVVDLARGDYCWLFSADDVMENGALEKMLIEIELAHDVYICMHSNETIDMQKIDDSHPVLNSTKDITFQLADVEQQLRYFYLAQTTEAFFSFISSLIIRRAKWKAVHLNEKFVGTCWAHVARLFELIPTGLAVKFIAAVLVRRRGENDSFSTQGVVRRYALALQGYEKLLAHFWGDDSRQAFHIRRVLKKEFPIRNFLVAKMLCAASPETEDKCLLDELVASTYYDRSLVSILRRVTYRLFPVALIEPSRVVYKRLRRRAGAKR